MAKGHNDKRAVSTTRGVKGGYMFDAPEGTEVPTDIETPLPDTWTCCGFISEDGIKEAVDKSSSDLKDMGGDVVDTYSESQKETIAVTLIEIASEALSMQYGHRNVEERDGMIVVDHNWGRSDETRAIVFELLLKDGRRWRKVIPAGKVSDLGEFTGSSTTVAGRELTVTYTVNESGSGCKDYIEALPAEEGSLEGMTLPELRSYAQARSIDLEGRSLKADVVEAIRAAEGGEAR